MVRGRVEVLGVNWVLFLLWNDDGGLQKVIQCLSIESNDFPLNPTMLGQAVLWIIGICIELLHQSDINPLLWEACKPAMPLPSLKLAVELVVHGGGKLHVSLQKDVPKVNVVLVSVSGGL